MHSAMEVDQRRCLPQAGLVRWQAPSMYSRTERMLEKRDWALIPKRHRTQVPKDLQQLDFPLAHGEELVMSKLTRKDQGWLVSGVK